MIQISIHKSGLPFGVLNVWLHSFPRDEEKISIQLEVNNLVEHNIQNICESFLVEVTTNVDGNY